MNIINSDSALIDSSNNVTLPITGERLIPEIENGSSNYQVHFSRYVYAEQFVNQDSEILDYGCGTGYGLQHLAPFTPKRCVGIDKQESIEYAQQKYPAETVSYIAGDLTNPTTRFGQFDLVVSFDVIEHVSNIGLYLENIAAQLRNSTSIALISTPWSYRRNNILPLHNPYHMCELTVTEFFDQLDPYFKIDDILLTLGMMATVRLKNSSVNNLKPMSISLSGEHIIALEESIENLSQRVEILEALESAVQHTNQRVRESQEEYLFPPTKSPLMYDSTDYSIQAIQQDTRLSTRFVAEDDNLSAVDVPLTAYNRLSGSDIRLSLFRDKTRVACAVVPGILIQEEQQQRFIFSPIPDSAGIEFSLVLDIPSESFDAPIGAWCDSHNRPLFQAYYRRYRWEGAPKYSTTTEFISARQTSIDAPVKTSTESTRSLHSSTPYPPKVTSSLPPATERPWSPETSTSKKLLLSLRHYGIAATIRELKAYAAWKSTRD